MELTISYRFDNPASHLNRKNVVETCKKCHASANRQFAGYFTHATHHDPHKYPWLFWTFWGMTGLLVGTFVLARLTYFVMASTLTAMAKRT
ncbi:MAG: hypothetical protein MZV64_41095 [Ignavibacteriales bacterium]|nr:hypothetical protein [Ignavibacteriales bacterium]